MRTVLLSVALVLGASALASPAHAVDPEEAVAELRIGYSLKQADRCDEALPHLRRSHDLVPGKPKPLLNLADCEQRLGDLVVARDHFAEGRDLARRENDIDLVAAATEKLTAIDRALPRLTITLGARAPTATTITLDGVTLDSSTLATPMAVNPGRHVVTASAAGWTDRNIDVSLGEGTARTIEVAPLGLPANPYASRPASDARPGLPTWHTREIASLGLVGAGVVSAGIGGAFGFIAISNRNASNANGHCDVSGCDAVGKNLRNAALGDAAASTWLIGLGLAAAAGGGALIVTTPMAVTRSVAQVEVVPLAGPHLNGVGVRGAW
jgi:hypothetical protein